MNIFKVSNIWWSIFLSPFLLGEISEFDKALKPDLEAGIDHAVIISDTCIVNDRYSKWYRKETRKVKIKVFTKKGIEDFGTLKILDYGGKSIRNFKGKVYLENGESIPISPSDIKKKTITKEWGTKVIEMSIAIPGLQKGAIIEYSYEKTLKRLKGIYKWVFSNQVPTLYSRVQIIPKIQSAWAYYSQNPSGKAVISEYDKNISFTRENIPPYRNEPFSLPESSLNDAIVFYYFRVVESHENYWYEWGDEMYKAFTEQVKPCRKSKKMVKEHFNQIPNSEKLQAIYEFVQNNYIPSTTLTSKERAELKKEISQMQWGGNALPSLLSSKILRPFEMYKVLVCLIKTALPECEIELVFYSPWDQNVFNSKILSTDQLTGTLIKVIQDKQVVWLEADKRFRPFGFFDNGAKMNTALISGKNGTNFQTIYGESCLKNQTLKESFVSLTTSDKAIIRTKRILDSYQSYLFRSVLLHLDEEGTKDVFRDTLLEEFGDECELIRCNFSNFEDISKPLVLEMEFSFPFEFQEVGEYVILDLLGIEKTTENPFNPGGRNGAIIFDYPKVMKHIIHFQFPDEYSLASTPKDIVINSRDYIYSIKFKKETGSRLLVKVENIVETNVFPAEKNKFFFDTFSQIMRAQDENIILKESDL